MSAADWTEVLDRAENLVNQHLQAFRDGTEPPTSEPWPALGPIPAELLPRANAILTATVQSYAEIDAARSRLLVALNTAAPPPTACFLDTLL